MTVTDSITFILSFILMLRGASRGVLRSLTGPFSILIATIVSIIYFQKTQNMFISLMIGLIGPLVLGIFFNILLKIGAAATGEVKHPTMPSRLAGAMLTLIWGWVFIIFTLILLMVIPDVSGTMAAVRKDVSRSISFKVVKPFEDRFFASAQKYTSASSGESSGADVRALAEDPRFQQVLQDPEIKKDIDAHDLGRLMSNPKMMDLVKQIMADPKTMKKVLALYQSQTQDQSPKNP